MRRTISLLANVLLLSIMASAQWTPISARIRVTTTRWTSSQAPTSEVREGYYFRTSYGSVLRQWQKKSGAGTIITSGDLVDAKNAVAYHLDYMEHRAIVTRRNFPVSPQEVFAGAFTSLGDDRVDNLQCSVTKLTLTTIAGQTFEAGRACISQEYGLILRTDMTVERADNVKVRTVTDIYDVHVGQEPDGTLFDVGRNFSVVAPVKPAMAPN
jgi:hypothetical protein